MTLSPMVYAGLPIEKRKIFIKKILYTMQDLDKYLKNNYSFFLVKNNNKMFVQMRNSLIYTFWKYKYFFDNCNKTTISKLFNKDHATIIHSIKSVENSIFLNEKRGLESDILELLTETEQHFLTHFKLK